MRAERLELPRTRTKTQSRSQKYWRKSWLLLHLLREVQLHIAVLSIAYAMFVHEYVSTADAVNVLIERRGPFFTNIIAPTGIACDAG